MEVLLQDCTGGRAYYQTVRRLSSLCNQPTNPDDDDDGCSCCCCCFFSSRKQIFLNIIIIIHLLHSHIHCDLHYSCSILTLHDLHFFFNPRNENFPPFEGNFSFHLHRWQHCFFSILPSEGRKSRDLGSGGGKFYS